jgi:hypothetical protein
MALKPICFARPRESSFSTSSRSAGNRIRLRLEAIPPETVRPGGPAVLSPLTMDITKLAPGQAFGLVTRGGNEHNIAQCNVNASVKGVRKAHPDREYVTRTLRPSDKLGPITVKEVTLGIYPNSLNTRS